MLRLLSAILVCGVAAGNQSVFQEVPPPDLSFEATNDNFAAWNNPGPPYSSLQDDVDEASDRLDNLVPATLQQKIRAERRILPGAFLPGLGIVRDFTSPALGPRTNRQTGFPVKIAVPTKDTNVITPTSISVSEDSPPTLSRRDDEKCEFVQMKGGVLGSNCTKGGMSCERKCEFETSEPECTEVLETVCEDVPLEKCTTVQDRTCKTVQEEVCDDPSKPASRQECDIVLEEECLTIVDDVCRNTTTMDCTTVEKEACTTLKEQVCRPSSAPTCQEVQRLKCDLVQDVICRNVTENRFDEKCWNIEEEVCKTVHDTVWENKCDMVNITVPQRDCDVIETIVMEPSCRILNETMNMPVCVSVMDQVADENCEELAPADSCFEQACSPVQKPVFTKDCRDVTDESCEVIIETTMEKKCEDFQETLYSEECSTVNEEICSTQQELVCEEAAPVAPPSDSYGVPKASTISLTTPRPSSYQRSPKQIRPRFSPDTLGRWRRKTLLSRTLKSSAESSESSQNKDAESAESEVSRRKRNSDEQISLEDIFSQNFINENSEAEAASSNPIKAKVYERSANYGNHAPFQGVGGQFQKFGNSEFQANYYGTPTTQRPVTTTPACQYVPRETCETKPKMTCTQVPRTEVKSVCIDFPVSSPQQRCNQTVRQECDVVESSTTEQKCDLVQKPLSSQRQCNYNIRSEMREECTQVTVSSPREVCSMVPKKIKNIECMTRMKEIELKEICVNIDIQLPREECKKQTREECRFEPTVATVQRCEPTVREECRNEVEEVCEGSCAETCADEDKTMCMTIPQQQCEEKITQQCEKVPREECKTTPREECRAVVGEPVPGKCRLTTKLDCTNTPRERCSKTFTSECRKAPQKKCTDRKSQNCKMECEPVYWCKMCE